MKMKTRWAALGLAVTMLAGSILGGCGNQSNADSAAKAKAETQQAKAEAQQEETPKSGTEETAATPDIDLSQKVDLVLYLVGDEPNGMEEVEEKINEIMLEKINATITFNFTSWTDYTNKYMMVLNGGEDCDLIYTASWLSFYELVNKNAFLDLNEYVDQYAPGLRDAIAPEILDQVGIGGHLYCIPTTYAEYEGGNYIYREDLRKKYDLPVPDSLENIEIYLRGIRDNEPDMEPTLATTAYMIQRLNHPSVSVGSYGQTISYDQPSSPQPYYGSEEQLEDLKIAQRWASEGFWSRSGIADLGTEGQEAFNNGRIAFLCEGINPAKYISSKRKLEVEQPDWEVGNVLFADVIGVAYPQSYLGNGTAIPQNSRNPERAIMAMELLFTDEELNHLVLYGIEGKNYNIDAEGYYEPIPDAAFDISSWSFKNTDLMLDRKDDQELKEIFAHMADVSAGMKYPGTNLGAGYNGEVENKNASAALSAVVTEYLTPVELGMVEDVEGAVEKFMEEARKVGLEELQEEFNGLWKAYCEEKGYE